MSGSLDDANFVRAMARGGGRRSSDNPWLDAMSLSISKQPKHSATSQEAADRLVAAVKEKFDISPVFVGEWRFALEFRSTSWIKVHYHNLTPEALQWLFQNWVDYDASSMGKEDPDLYTVEGPQ